VGFLWVRLRSVIVGAKTHDEKGVVVATVMLPIQVEWVLDGGICWLTRWFRVE
jgi:hypothetical protein